MWYGCGLLWLRLGAVVLGMLWFRLVVVCLWFRLGVVWLRAAVVAVGCIARTLYLYMHIFAQKQRICCGCGRLYRVNTAHPCRQLGMQA